MSKFNELVTKLREIFQIDRPELDFGVYRILNARADEINEYLEKRLKEKVEEALASGSAANLEQLKEELKKAEQGAQALGVDADTVPKVQELKAKISEATSGSAEHENAVFSHLLTFFSRYYDQGDFISQRRYKGDTYAIPYAGEEVMLHWANKDQYYIKSGENFSNYSFKLEDGRVVHFRLVSADTAKDNRKDNDKERRFVLAEHQIINRVDDEGDEYEEEVLPVEEIVNTDGEGNETKELVIRFEYKVVSKGRGNEQAKFVDSAVSTILAHEAVAARWLDVGKRAPTEKNPKRTLLEKHLTNYTTKNTSDYFIHKNLGLFLRGELDFYIKNEVLHLDDVSNAESFNDIEKNLRVIQCLRSIATDLIAFLTQLEDFQKALWVKKKFVVDSHYCLSVDRIPEELWRYIIENKAQWAKWRELGIWKSEKDGSLDNLKENLGLIVDTSLYEAKFKSLLLDQLENLDANVDGVLVNSDNFQALNLLSQKYQGKIDFTYIDPPYNTVHSKIAYKNQFDHSAWLSLISNTMPLSEKLMKKDFSFGFAIDDYEYNNAYNCIQGHFSYCDVSTIVINHHPQGSGGRLSRTHEYYIVASPKDTGQFLGAPKADDVEERSFMRSGTAENNYRSGRWRSFYALLQDPNTKEIVSAEEPPELGADYPLEPTDEGYIRIYPINSNNEERVWRSSFETGRRRAENREIFVTERGAIKQRIEHEGKRETLFSNWIGADYNAGTNGTNVLDALGLGGIFDYPKSVKTLEQSFWMQSFGKTDFLAIDYFAGSGTSAHAILSMNRKDKGKRKFILVEQGEYFDLVTKPRVIKASYSSDWENGKAAGVGTSLSTCFKIIKLESYEDTLNNLTLERTQQQQDLLSGSQSLKDDYLINYMLHTESRNSLLSIDDFKQPFDYSMNITTDSAGAFKEQKIDLVETFNYLIGLSVKHIDAQPDRGFVTVAGILPTGESCLILWRDCALIDYEGLNKLCDKLDINPADNEFDVVYINGDHNIPTVLTQTAEEGGETRVLKLRQIEPEFLERMFAEEDV